jgi:hypothetical protein
MRKDILYPLFLKYSTKIDDSFWKYVYEEMAYGKHPYGIYVQNDYICCFLKGKEFSYKMDENNPNQEEEIHTLLKNKAGILSEKEKIQNKNAFLNENRTNNSLNKKCIRDTLLENYILGKSEDYNINIDKCRKVISFLLVGFLFKLITLKDVQFNEKYIKNIKGLEFEDNKIILKNNFLYNKNFSFNSSIFVEENNKKNIEFLWYNYKTDIKNKKKYNLT